MIEVYTSEKPAGRTRAVLSATLLFAVAVGLAASMTWRRSADPLAEPFQPPDWGASFRPPAGFRPHDDPTAGKDRNAVRWIDGRGDVVLTYWRFGPEESVRPVDLCTEVVAQHGPGSIRLRQPRQLGGLRAIEALNEIASVVARCAEAPDGSAYAVSMWRSERTIDASLYRLFDRTCGSLVLLPA